MQDLHDEGGGWFSWCKPEWQVIAAAPRHFVVSVLALSILAGMGLYWLFHVNLEMKNDLISSQEKEISRLRSSVEELSKSEAHLKEANRIATSKAINSDPPPHDYKHFKSEAMEPINNRTYINETVELDGKVFQNCRFVNVTLMYHGLGPTGILGCNLEGTTMIETDNAALSTMLAFIGTLQKMPHEDMFIGEKDPATGNRRLIWREGEAKDNLGKWNDQQSRGKKRSKEVPSKERQY